MFQNDMMLIIASNDFAHKLDQHRMATSGVNGFNRSCIASWNIVF